MIDRHLSTHLMAVCVCADYLLDFIMVIYTPEQQ